ncbi:MAG: cytochrome c [Bacteroidia bacterium]|nr:cytochrome c [Bacteroidia bacterium]MCZ2277553.1 cytochrome c [Bacteroidia bacterium]
MNKTNTGFQIDIRKCFRQFIMLITGLLLIGKLSLQAQDGEAIFKQNCSVCHKIGGGRLIGPDLAGITSKRSIEWLLKWTKASQALVKSGDAEAKAIFDEYKVIMPDQNLPDAELRAVYAFIDSKSADVATSAESSSTTEVVADASNQATQEQISNGKRLFTGAQGLINGGPACISCHNVNYKGVIPGGLLAKDLTDVYSRLGGDIGLHGIMGAPPFPAMTQSYLNKPITENEIADITAFLNRVDKDKTSQQASMMNPLLYGGSAGIIALLILIYILWSSRKRFTVKREIYNRQIRSI